VVKCFLEMLLTVVQATPPKFDFLFNSAEQFWIAPFLGPSIDSAIVTPALKLLSHALMTRPSFVEKFKNVHGVS
jgi:hypothetical protein